MIPGGILRNALLLLAILGLCVLPRFASAQFETLFTPESGRAWFVSAATGNNGNDGTRAAPLKNIDKAIKSAAPGDTIIVAEGVYMGTFNIGFLKSDKPLRLYGGFSPDFNTRDIVAHATLFQPDNASAAKSREALLTFTREIDGTIIDGFIFDMGMRNSYSPEKGRPEGVESGMLLLAPAKAPGESPTVDKPILSIPSAAMGGDITISNCVFVNGASFAIQAGMRSGTMKIENNIFVANRMAAIEVYGTSATEIPLVEITHNTILFTWSRLEDFQDMGYGIRIMTKARYSIHDNIIGGNIKGAIDHTRFNPDENISIDNNIFFVNKTADLYYSPASNTSLNLRAAEFGDLPIASATGNREEIPPQLDVDKAYLEGYLSASYTEETSLDRDSPANQWRSILGMNLVGQISTEASMFANRYPWQNAAAMFGAVQGTGAQNP